jgi:hypothetical protein
VASLAKGLVPDGINQVDLDLNLISASLLGLISKPLSPVITTTQPTGLDHAVPPFGPPPRSTRQPLNRCLVSVVAVWNQLVSCLGTWVGGNLKGKAMKKECAVSLPRFHEVGDEAATEGSSTPTGRRDGGGVSGDEGT